MPVATSAGTPPASEAAEVGAGPADLAELFASSWSIVRAHPVISSGIGAAMVLSFASTVFGIGVVVTPWFVCELFAVQLAVLTGRLVPRQASWVRAGLLVLCLVGLVVAATWLAILAVGPDVATADAAAAPLPWPEAVGRVLTIAGVTALAVGFITPFQYAPLILIERGGTISASAFESAWLVLRGGLVRHWALAFLAQVLPLAPAFVAAVVVARTFERAATPVGVLLGLPLLPLSIPLGQGLLTAAYVRRRRELAEPRWTRAEGQASSLLVVLLIAVVLAPMASIALLALGAGRSSPPLPGPAGGEVVIARAIEGPSTVFVPDTTLRIEVSDRTVTVRSGDGGGTGTLSEPWRSSIEWVGVRRLGDVYGVEIDTADGRWHASVDRAAMRVDDSVGARLQRRLPAWALPSIALAFALSALLLVRGLAPLGAVRRAYGAPIHQRPSLAELEAQRAAAVRRGWLVVLALLPPATLAVVAGMLASIG